MKELKGKFVLIKDLGFQGIVEEVEGDWALIQTFSWVMGHDYDLRLFHLKELTGNCAFFKTEEEFKRHADKYIRDKKEGNNGSRSKDLSQRGAR